VETAAASGVVYRRRKEGCDVVKAYDTLARLTDRELAAVLEQILERRAIGFDETFSPLAPHERLLAKLRAVVVAWKLQMETPK
jgi:hypothetical protein